MIALLRRLFAAKPQRHYQRWHSGPEGYYAKCACGYHSPWDYDLRKHFEDMGRIGE